MTTLRTAWPWAGAGLAFAAYPALRPWTDETGAAGLAAMASTRWLLAHLLGMTAFALLALALGRLGDGWRASSRAAGLLGPLGLLGAFLLLPYYGGEAFGLHAVGRHALDTGDTSMLAVVDGFRYQPLALAMFGLGLITLAVAGVLAGVVTWHQGAGLRAAVLVVAVGLVTYLPQFFAPAPVRVGHGIVLGLGCSALAVLLSRRPGPAAAVALAGRATLAPTARS
jgi:hypothetical protein